MRLSSTFTALLLCLAATGPALAGIPPGGFQETTVVSGITLVTGFDWTPAGDLWIISKPGVVYVLHPGASQPVVAATIPVNVIDERGLLGIAFDPGFPAVPYIYLYYTVDGANIHNRVSRFTVSGDSLLNETPLLEGPTLLKVYHNSGNLRFGPDGYLYISMGDNAFPLMSQRLDSLLGKILRIAPNGSIPPTNPFVGDPNARHEIWAYGVRNVWRFDIQPGTGNLFLADVGDADWEELDLGVAGANYGYPLTEGPYPAGVVGVTYPIYYYNHNGGSAAITGGDHMVAGNFPSQYVGDYFFGEYVKNEIYRMTLDANNRPVTVETFMTQANTPVHIRVGPDGALYYAGISSGTIFRVAYVGGTNQLPVAIGTETPGSGLFPLTVQFDGTASFDPDGTIQAYHWTFGDESPGTNTATASRTYNRNGVFFPHLQVDDGQGTSGANLRVVVGNRAPTASILSPANGGNFNAGDVITFNGSATDPEDGSLAAPGFTWSVLFHHQTHTHPWLGPMQAITGGSFATADSGESSTDVWYEILLTATDSGNPIGTTGTLSDTRSVSIYPNLSSFTLATTPRADLGLTLDGRPVTAPVVEPSVVALKRDIEALSPQAPGDGHTYTYSSWSDGGAQLHTIATPASPATYTARFNCNLISQATNVVLVPAAGGGVTLSWTAPADICLAVTGPVIYKVYESAGARPATLPGNFPLDPAFSLVATTSSTSATITPGSGNRFYLVVGMGSDGVAGPVGSYGH